MKDSLLSAEIVSTISGDLSLPATKVEATLKLILDDCTVPFIARYRKEATGELDEVQIRDIRDKFEYVVALNERKEAILRSIEEQGKLSPQLKQKILACKVKSELEDLYLPYKPKKRSKGQIAKERGLEPLALQVLAQDAGFEDLAAPAMALVGSHEDLKTLEVVLQGVKDYVAEAIGDTPEIRGEIRQWTFENASFRSEAREEFKEQKTKFNNYYSFSEPVRTIAPHRLMALRRGEKENILKVTLDFDESTPLSLVEARTLLPSATAPVRAFLKDACADAYKRIISTSIETELRLETKNRAEDDAIQVFAKNLKNLLLLPPIPSKVVLGVDPGLRTGSKLTVVDQTGKLLEHTTIFPDHDAAIDAQKNRNAVEKVLDFVRRHKVNYVSIGNGTAGREMEAFVEKAIATDAALAQTKVVVVNESGASVYSASDVAREEFPDLDITYRGAVSIARRLQDPLAELVKIEPKSIGVGQYQHDVNQTKLKKQLEEVVESCVNYVGVRVNTASPSLLGYVAGIGPTLAKNIVKHREAKGEFKSRESLFEVMGFGPKAFEQAAGFLRVPESAHPLDNTGVHPEAYKVVERMAGDLGMPLPELLGKRDAVSKVQLEKYVTEEIGLPTLQDIVKELLKPGRDPREQGVKHSYNREVRDFGDLKEGQILSGSVTNVTNFGAFVDIGVHQDGLVHISELSHTFIKDPAEAVSVGDQVKVKVIGIDKERKRISLSKKAAEEPPARAQGGAGAPIRATWQDKPGASGNAGNRPDSTRGGGGQGPRGPGGPNQRSGIAGGGGQGGAPRTGGAPGPRGPGAGSGRPFEGNRSGGGGHAGERGGYSGERGGHGGDRSGQRPAASARPQHGGNNQPRASSGPLERAAEPTGPASMADLLAKFNNKRM